MARGKKRTSAKAKRVAAKRPVTKSEKDVPEIKRTKWHARVLGVDSRRATREQAKILLPDREPVSGAPTIFLRSLRVLLNEWKLFSVMLLVYALLHLLLVGGLT